MATVSIIVPFRDKIDMTNDCLRTLDAIVDDEERASIEVVLVNNRSSAEQLALLQTPARLTVRRLDLDIDFNFQTVINRGAAAASGDFLLLLNNDILFDEGSRGFLKKMVAVAARPDVGAVGPLLYYPDGSLQHAGVVIGMNTYADHLYRGWTPDQARAFPFTDFAADRYVSAVTAAFVMVETRKFQQIQGMDERFIICGGDVDLCIRLSFAGYQSVYLGSVSAIHLESKSRDPGNIPAVDFAESRRSYGEYLKRHDGRDPFYPEPLSLFPVVPQAAAQPAVGVQPPVSLKRQLKNRVKAFLRWQREVRIRMHTEPLELIIAKKLVKLRHRLRASRIIAESTPAQDAQRFRLAHMAPLRGHSETLLAPRRRLNVVLPHYNDYGVFAGIITAVAVGAKVALKHDCELRFLFVDGVGKLDALRRDLRSTLGPDADRLEFTGVEVYDRAHVSLNFHDQDTFLATAWWTCFQIRSLIGDRRFLYLIQDFECGFYPWGDWYANCLATYAMNYVPIFNTGFLRDFFLKKGLVSPAAAAEGGFFEPAVSKELFNVPRRKKGPGEKRRLFFYGRESIARNLFPIGITALSDAVERGILDPAKWEFVSAGQPHAPVALGRGATLRSVGKMSLKDYAQFLSETDVGVSLMLSPHPSYPPLEIAAAGALSVTNSFENKDVSTLSPNIISCAPSIEGVVEGLRIAAERLKTEELLAPRPLSLPGDWNEALDGVADKIFHAMGTL